MNNKEIIEKLGIEVYGEDLIKDFKKKGLDIPLYTKNQWEKKGHKVQEEAEGHTVNLNGCHKGKFYTYTAKVFSLYEIE